MATTYNDYDGDGNATKTFNFPLYTATDVKVEVDNVLKDLTTHYTTSYTDGASSGTVTFTSGNIPTAPAKIHIYRDTDVDTQKITFAAGSAIKAADLNNFYKQLLYSVQEEQNQPVRASGLADGLVVLAKLASNSVDSSKIIDGSIVNADINASAGILGSKIAASSGSAAGSMSSSHYTKLEGIEASADVTDSTNVNAAGAVMNTDTATTDMQFVVDEDNMSSDSATKVPTQQSVKAYIDTNHYNKTDADARYYNLASTEEIQSGETWAAADNKVATTAAIDARIIDLVDDVGGFVPITNETSFPNTNPDVNNPATGGTIVSIKSLASSLTSNGSGVATIANGNVASDATITINGLANSTTYAAGIGMLVETTSTLHTYTFHRQSPDATSTTTVAGSITNVNTVATNIANVNTVAGNNTNINTVAGANSNITTVAGANSNITTVATNVTDVNNFADLYQISASAPSTDGGGNALAAGDLWYDSSSNKALKVHNGTAFAAVSPTQSVLDDIAIVSGDLTRQEDLGNVSDALASATTTSDLETCADNITSINSFANVYRIASSAPSSSLDEGDLWYDSTANLLKYYNGTTWSVTAAAGLSAISEDVSPELGGNLDCNNKNLTEVATVSGDNLQIDFGTIS